MARILKNRRAQEAKEVVKLEKEIRACTLSSREDSWELERRKDRLIESTDDNSPIDREINEIWAAAYFFVSWRCSGKSAQVILKEAIEAVEKAWNIPLDTEVCPMSSTEEPMSSTEEAESSTEARSAVPKRPRQNEEASTGAFAASTSDSDKPVPKKQKTNPAAPSEPRESATVKSTTPSPHRQRSIVKSAFPPARKSLIVKLKLPAKAYIRHEDKDGKVYYELLLGHTAGSVPGEASEQAPATNGGVSALQPTTPIQKAAASPKRKTKPKASRPRTAGSTPAAVASEASEATSFETAANIFAATGKQLKTAASQLNMPVKRTTAKRTTAKSKLRHELPRPPTESPSPVAASEVSPPTDGAGLETPATTPATKDTAPENQDSTPDNTPASSYQTAKGSPSSSAVSAPIQPTDTAPSRVPKTPLSSGSLSSSSPSAFSPAVHPTSPPTIKERTPPPVPVPPPVPPKKRATARTKKITYPRIPPHRHQKAHESFHEGANIALENILEDHQRDSDIPFLEIIDDLEEGKPTFPNENNDVRRMVLRGAEWVYEAVRTVWDGGEGKVERGEVERCLEGIRGFLAEDEELE